MAVSMAEHVPSATNTPHSTSHVETEQRWANAGENLAVLNFSEKVCFLSALCWHHIASKALRTWRDAPLKALTCPDL